MSGKHKLICVAGRSGSGKDFLVSQICERTDATQVISYTTRPRRTNEGDTHRFVTEEDYQEMLAQGRVAAYTKIGEFRYWSTIDQLYENTFYIIDPVGIKTLRELDIPDIEIIVVYIKTDEAIREHRALNIRGDDKVVYRKRCFAESGQFREFVRDESFDYAVSNNGNPAEAYTVLRYIALVNAGIKPMNKEESA